MKKVKDSDAIEAKTRSIEEMATKARRLSGVSAVERVIKAGKLSIKERIEFDRE